MVLFALWMVAGIRGNSGNRYCKCHKSMNTPICNEIAWTLMWLSAKLLTLSSCVLNRCFAECLLQTAIGVWNVRAFLPLCLNQAQKAMCTPEGEDLNELILRGEVRQCRGWLGSSKLALKFVKVIHSNGVVPKNTNCYFLDENQNQQTYSSTDSGYDGLLSLSSYLHLNFLYKNSRKDP